MKPMYQLLSLLLYMLSLLPMRVLYLLSHLLFYPFYHLLRYRRRVVRENLSMAFPSMNKKSRKKIELTFYHHFCDYFFETVKLMTISRKNIMKRVRIEGLESVENCLKNRQPCFLLLSHTFNWEWLTSLPLALQFKETLVAQVYQAEKNSSINRLLLHLRSRFSSVNVSKEQLSMRMARWNKEHEPVLVGIMGDLAPSWEQTGYWLKFFGRETPVITGVEKIARHYDCAVFYCTITLLGRGRYCFSIKPLTLHASRCEPYKITDCYFKHLEDDIAQAPAQWLWSHNRWKRSRNVCEMRDFILQSMKNKGNIRPK